MLENIPKISVLVICYKQENVIRRAMDSLIAQKDYIYEICINDDKSPDKTWEILLEYQAKYPDLVKPVRNDPNLFIFANIEATWKRPTGNLIYQLSGDDEVPDGYFKHVCEFVKEKGLDCDNDNFCIYGDYEQVEPSGVHFYFSNKKIIKYDPIMLKTRSLISNRSACFSIGVLRNFIPVSDGRSYAVEHVQDGQLQLFSKKNYYIPYSGNIYYSSIGVSVSMNPQIALERAEEIDNKTVEFFERLNIKLSFSTKHYLSFMRYYNRFKFTKSKRSLLLMMFHYILSLDFSLGFDTLLLGKFLRKIRKKIKK